VIGLTTFLIGLLADLISFNRQLLEMTLEKVRRLELALNRVPAGASPAHSVAERLAVIEEIAAHWREPELGLGSAQLSSEADAAFSKSEADFKRSLRKRHEA
jgi:hypothetical protein